MSFLIRRAERRDLDALGRLGALMVRIHHAFDAKRFLAPQEGVEAGYAAFLGRLLDSDEDAVFVAEDGGAVIGYVYAALEGTSWVELRGPAGVIHDIIVAEGSRRAGVATQLMQTAVAWMRERGAPQAVLGTAVPNKAAQQLFHRLGFRETMIEMTMELNV